jgi:hypothetical protein
MSFQLENMDAGNLLLRVRQATGRPMLEMGEWSCQPFYGGGGEGLGIYRYRGQGIDRGEQVIWSIILKVFGEPAEAMAVTDWNYWRREVDVYQSDFLDHLPEGIRAPVCMGVQELGRGRVGVWSEDIVELVKDWSIEEYGFVAYDFGRFNGEYLSGLPIPTYPWLSRRWLHGWVERSGPSIPVLKRNLDNPWIKRVYPPDVLQILDKIWQERDWYYNLLAQLPQTLCHMDAFRRNLFICRGSGQDRETIAIDWAFVGPGAVGEELVPLIMATIAFREFDISKMIELEKRVVEGYLAGLSDVGWMVNAQQVWLGYMAAASLRYTVGAFGNVIPILLDEQLHPVMERSLNSSFEDICDYWSEFFLQSADHLLPKTIRFANELGLA